MSKLPSFPASSAFFKRFRKDELGSTKIVQPNAALGSRGDYQKMIDLTVPDEDAAPLIVSLRTEYTINANTVSSTPGAPQPISNATNAAPIVITTPSTHGLLTGTQITITGVNGNLGANGVFTITVISPTTFSLNGSVGSDAYLGGGSYVFLLSPGTGTGEVLIGGPLVGRVQWGVGGGYNVIEFDIPTGRIDTMLEPGTPEQRPVFDIGNGVQLYINASHVSVYVRNDGNLSPVNAPDNVPDRIGSPVGAKIIAFVAPGASRGGPPIQRTIYAVGGVAPGVPLLPGATVAITIPMFARRVRFARTPIATTPINIRIRTAVAVFIRQFDIPINSEGPIEIKGDEVIMEITNNGAVNINHLQAYFDVDPI